MALSSNQIRRVRNVIGDRRETYGTFSGSGKSGTIDTGLKVCENIMMTGTAGATGSANFRLRTKLPASGSAIPFFSPNITQGIWRAIGY